LRASDVVPTACNWALQALMAVPILVVSSCGGSHHDHDVPSGRPETANVVEEAASVSSAGSAQRPAPSAQPLPRALPGKPDDRGAPLPSELLPEPIALPGCPGFEIVEWQSAEGTAATSGPNEAAVTVSSDLCRKAVEGFPQFLRARRIWLPRPNAQTRVQISLLNHGERPRELNDTRDRFRHRKGADGRAVRVWGHYDPAERRIFSRNDLVYAHRKASMRVARVFIHEIFHALCHAGGVTEHYCHGEDACAERLAHEFTRWLPIGRRAENREAQEVDGDSVDAR